MLPLPNAQYAHAEPPSIVVGALASYSANSADRDTEHSLSTLQQQDDLAEATVIKEHSSHFLGLILILIIASVGYPVIRRIRRAKTRRRRGRSYF